MGLIINDKIRKMLVGYPTVSDKYNVAGGILSGVTAVHFGDLVQVSSTPGYFTPATSLSAVTDIGGFVLATNVKLAQDWPATTVQVNPGEAFNLLINGFIAVELDSAATEAQIKPNAQMCVILSTGKVTTVDKYNASTAPYLPNCVFTGEYEKVGSVLIAEVYVK